MNGVVAVHVGAGYHSDDKMRRYKRLCKAACKKAISVLEHSDGRAADAVTAAVAVLEDDPVTNAGYGSNLTMAGTVECDASIMDGRSLKFGAVGALSGFRNPILVAREIYDQQVRNSLSLGRIPPCFLVGEGAVEWAKKNVLTAQNPCSLISADAKKVHVKYKRKLDSRGETDTGPKTGKMDTDGVDSLNKSYDILPEAVLQKLDTVGAVCLDKSGNVASAVSSGGILLKQRGRVGQAALYGCGCWAEAFGSSLAVAATTSGGGEHLIKTTLASRCAKALRACAGEPVPALHDCFKEHFLESRFLSDVEAKLGGVLALYADLESGTCDVIWAHSTKTLCYGYMQTGGTSAKFGCSRLPDAEDVGKTVVVGGAPFRLEPFS